MFSLRREQGRVHLPRRCQCSLTTQTGTGRTPLGRATEQERQVPSWARCDNAETSQAPAICGPGPCAVLSSLAHFNADKCGMRWIQSLVLLHQGCRLVLPGSHPVLVHAGCITSPSLKVLVPAGQLPGADPCTEPLRAQTNSPRPSGGLLSLYIRAAQQGKCLRNTLQQEKESRGWPHTLLGKSHTHTRVHKHTEGLRNGALQHATRGGMNCPPGPKQWGQDSQHFGLGVAWGKPGTHPG